MSGIKFNHVFSVLLLLCILSSFVFPKKTSRVRAHVQGLFYPVAGPARFIASTLRPPESRLDDKRPAADLVAENRPTIQEIYDNYKLAEDMQSGAYSNTVLMGHSQTEFFFDFITGFYPTPSVAARVILPALQGPRFLNTLKNAMQQYHNRYVKPPEPPPPLQHP